MPTKPLRNFARLCDIPVESLGIDGQAQTIPLSRADEVSCKVLRVHPHAVYGDAYFSFA